MTVWAASGQPSWRWLHKGREHWTLLRKAPDANLLGCNFDFSQGQLLRNPTFFFLSFWKWSQAGQRECARENGMGGGKMDDCLTSSEVGLTSLIHDHCLKWNWLILILILSGGFERLGGTDVEAAQGGRAHRRGNQRGGEVSRIKANEDRQKDRHTDKKTDTQTKRQT